MLILITEILYKEEFPEHQLIPAMILSSAHDPEESHTLIAITLAPGAIPVIEPFAAAMPVT
jgi:hypothetical protein